MIGYWLWLKCRDNEVLPVDMRNRMETVSVSREDDKEVAKLEVEVKENLAMLSHMTMDHMSHQ